MLPEDRGLDRPVQVVELELHNCNWLQSRADTHTAHTWEHKRYQQHTCRTQTHHAAMQPRTRPRQPCTQCSNLQLLSRQPSSGGLEQQRSARAQQAQEPSTETATEPNPVPRSSGQCRCRAQAQIQAQTLEPPKDITGASRSRGLQQRELPFLSDRGGSRSCGKTQDLPMPKQSTLGPSDRHCCCCCF